MRSLIKPHTQRVNDFLEGHFQYFLHIFAFCFRNRNKILHWNTPLVGNHFTSWRFICFNKMWVFFRRSWGFRPYTSIDKLFPRRFIASYFSALPPKTCQSNLRRSWYFNTFYVLQGYHVDEKRKKELCICGKIAI